MVASISFFSIFIPRGFRCLFNEIVWILREYHCLAAWKEVINESILFIAFRIASFIELSISAFALSFRSPEIAPKGVSHNRRSLICSERPWSFIALSMTSRRFRILTDWLVFSLLKRIRLFIDSRSFLSSISLFWGFLC
jgi:hypothetical protein